MNSFRTKLILLCLSASLIQLVHSQGNCERITPEILGNTTHEESAGLISELITLGGGETQASPPVRVKEFNIVCEAQAMTQFRYRYTSVVVSYTCTSVDPRLPQCDGSDTISQFDLGCNSNEEWTPTIFSTSMYVETAMPSATLSTTKESRCGVCANSTHPFFTARNAIIESDTHCERCIGCTEGLMRCTNRGSGTCCNYFLQGICVERCDPLVPNAANECVCIRLEDENAMFNRSDGEEIGSRANLTCDSGYQPEGSFTSVVCTTDGWSNTLATCIPVYCGSLPEPENGMFQYSNGQKIGSRANLTCNSGYQPEGSGTSVVCTTDGWGNNTATCIRPCNSKIENCEECVIEGSVICTRCANGSELIGLGQCRATSAAGGCDIHGILGVVLATLTVLFIANI